MSKYFAEVLEVRISSDDKEVKSWKDITSSKIHTIYFKGKEYQEVNHGKWLPYEFGDYHWHKCSSCGKAHKYIETFRRPGRKDCDVQSITNYCPNCGALMMDKETE